MGDDLCRGQTDEDAVGGINARAPPSDTSVRLMPTGTWRKAGRADGGHAIKA
ncbi:MAG: hypothetical protein ACYCTF_05365 [Acidiferrobacter sp.]